MSDEIELTRTPKIIILALIGLIFFGITADRASLHFDKTTISALNRPSLISHIGPWLHSKIQKHEPSKDWVRRKINEIRAREYYRCTIGLIDVRGFGSRVVAGVNVTDNAGSRFRYFILDWNAYTKEWVCSFYSSGDNSGIHPEENGYGFIGKFFKRARLEGTTKYQDQPL